MINDMTTCPNCKQKSVTEYDNAFACSSCGNWGYSASRLPYSHEQAQDFRPSGQVYRKPRAA